MLRRLMLAVTVGVFIITGVAGYARAVDQPIGTKVSLIKPGKLYKIVSKHASGWRPGYPGWQRHGERQWWYAQLHIVNTGL